MNEGLIFFCGLVVGAILGFITAGFLATSSDCDDMAEAYNEGFVDGKKAATEMNNTTNNEHNDTRY